jgi:hypothetical protein
MNSLNSVLEFEHVIRVRADGTVIQTGESGVWAPEVCVELDDDGQILDVAESAMVEAVESAGWELMTGYSRQSGYAGPIMHSCEYVGGDMEQDILERPGLYVVVEVTGLHPDPESEAGGYDAPVGWVVARRLVEVT